MKILPIDATGTLGSRILREAVSHGHEMTGVVRHEGALSPAPCVHVVQLDASDAGEVARLRARHGHNGHQRTARGRCTDPGGHASGWNTQSTSGSASRWHTKDSMSITKGCYS